MLGLRVLLLCRERREVREVSEVIKSLGHVVVGLAGNDAMALRSISITHPDLVIICGYRQFPDTARMLTDETVAPLVIIEDRSWLFGSRIGCDESHFSITHKPLQADKLALVIKIELEKFQRLAEINRDHKVINAPTNTRVLVSKATEVWAKKTGLEKLQAMCQLQVIAQQRGVSLRQLAIELVV